MQGLLGEVAVCSGRGESVVGQGVGAGDVGDAVACARFAASGVDDGAGEQFSGVVDADPQVLGARDTDGAVAGRADGGLVGVEVDVAARCVMRQHTGGTVPPACVVLAHDGDVVADGLVVGRVVVEDAPATAAVGLDPPDAHIVADAEVPRGVDGAVWVGFVFGFEVSTLPEAADLHGVDGAVGDGVESFFGRGRIFLPHAAFLGLRHGDVPGFLLGAQRDVVFAFECGEVALLLVCRAGVAVAQGVFGVPPPREEVELEVQRRERFADVVHGVADLLVVDAVFAAFVC